MQVSTISLPVFWLSISLPVTIALSGHPSLMPRRGFTIDTVHNEKHMPNGVAAKAKAMAKFAHLADGDNIKVLDDSGPSKSSSLIAASDICTKLTSY